MPVTVPLTCSSRRRPACPVSIRGGLITALLLAWEEQSCYSLGGGHVRHMHVAQQSEGRPILQPRLVQLLVDLYRVPAPAARFDWAQTSLSWSHSLALCSVIVSLGETRVYLQGGIVNNSFE